MGLQRFERRLERLVEGTFSKAFRSGGIQPVEIGRRGAGYVEIREGIAEGDVVVTSANFLIDAESNLKSALKTMTEPGAPQ